MSTFERECNPHCLADTYLPLLGVQQLATMFSRFERCHRDPPKGKMVFFGDSDIARWNAHALEKSFPGSLPCAVGGATMKDCSKYAKALVRKYKPSLVVLVAGENDIGERVSPRDVLKLLQAIHRALAHVPMVIMSTKPEPSTKSLWRKYQEYNAMARSWCEDQGVKSHCSLAFLDSFTPFAERGVHMSLFAPDGLHLSPLGYDIWEDLIHSAVAKVNIRSASSAGAQGVSSASTVEGEEQDVELDADSSVHWCLHLDCLESLSPFSSLSALTKHQALVHGHQRSQAWA